MNFEQAFAATQMAALLAGQSSVILGDDVRLESVTFQGEASPLDDLLLRGEPVGGVQRTAVVGVRHDPTIGRSDSKFVVLLGTIAAAFAGHRDECLAGIWRLGLVVKDPHTPARELARLTDLARDSGAADPVVFAGKVADAAKPIRTRLTLFSEALDKAITTSDLTGQAGALGSPERGHFRCELLTSLYVLRAELEGDIARDETAAIQQLSALTSTPADAENLWDSLIAIAADDNPTGAQINEASLRRKLARHRIPAGQRHTAALALLDQLETSLRDRSRGQLRQPPPRNGQVGDDVPAPLSLPRGSALDALVKAIEAPGTADVLVTGAPGTGKSALALNSVDRLRADGAHVVPLHATSVTGLGTLGDPFNGKLADVLACATTADRRYLLIDGAETATTGGQLSALAVAGRRAGYRVVVVARDDVLDDLVGVLTSVDVDGGLAPAPSSHKVSPLGPGEVEQVVCHFPSLTTIAARPRAHDLLSRLGLVDAVLRSAPSVTADPGAPFTELNVFDRYWKGAVAVRRDGASAAGREQAAIALARKMLRPDGGSEPREPGAVDSLRLDGVVASASPFSATATFATDLDLDFATARLLITDGLGLLEDAPRPRAAMRAARLAIQARLASEGVTALGVVRTELAAVASAHGTRWNDLADEAILGHPAAADLLTSLWPRLAADPQALAALIGTAKRLYYPRDAATGTPRGPRTRRPNPATEAIRPLVDLLAAHDAELISSPRKVREAYGEILVAYLRGVSWHRWPEQEAGTVRAIAAVLAARDERASSRPDPEAIALLGPDHHDLARSHLLAVATDHPSDLGTAVDSPYSVLALAADDPELLAGLSRAYYIEPDSFRSYAGDGVRDHTLELSGRYGTGPDRGPFTALLMLAPEHGLPLVREVLQRGAFVRQMQMAGDDVPWALPAERQTRAPVTLDLPASGVREFVGDSQAWYWHRGTGVGPDACVSAAMAFDGWARQRVLAGDPAADVARLIMEGAATLAEAGIAFGLLLRGRPATDHAITGWLHERLVSQLEIGRQQQERRVGDTADGEEWRTLPPNGLATALVAQALRDGDRDQLEQLRAAADRLIELNTSGDGALAPEIALSASLLKPETYVLVGRGGEVLLLPRPDQEVADALAPGNADLAAFGDSLGLIERYSPATERHPLDFRLVSYLTPAQQSAIPVLRMRADDPGRFAEQFRLDFAAARRLVERPLPEGMSIFGPGPVCAVAAFVLIAEDLDELITGDDRDWAVTQLVASAGYRSPFESRDTDDERGPSRSSARALPGALASGHVPGREEEIIAALAELAIHPALEVRRTLVTNLREVWSEPCRVTSSGRCVHAETLDVVTRILADAPLPAGAGDRPQPAASTADHTVHDPGMLDCRVVGLAAAAAVDAATACGGCTEAGEQARSVSQQLVEAVLAMAEASRSDRHAYDLLAGAALRQDASAGSLGLVATITSRLAGTGRLALWRSAVFGAAEHEPGLADTLGDGWPALAAGLLEIVPVNHPEPDQNPEQVDLIDLAALLPPASAARPLPAELAGFMPSWLSRAVNNRHAIDCYCSWAPAHSVPTAEAIDVLDQLIPNLAAPPSELRHLGDLIDYLTAAALTDEQQRRVHVQVDALKSAGYTSLQRFQTEET